MASTLQVDGAITSSAGMTITTADNTTQLTLKSTDADGSVGPVLDLVRDSASPADGDAIGQIKFIADNDAGEATTYSSAFTTLRDASNGAEDGQTINYVMTAGGLVDYLRMGRGSANGQSEVVINEGSADVDFRVESDGNANMLFVDGGNNLVGIGTDSPNSYYSKKLVVSSPDENGITIVGTTSSYNYLMFADGTSGDATYRGYLGYDHADDSMVFATAATNRLRIAADGSLSTPTAGTSNVRFGVNAGNSIQSGGNYNVVVGDEAGTAITTGDLHTFIGYGAGDAVSTEATGLTAIGANALTSNTSGTNNLAIGTSALEDCTEGIGNIAVGRYAGADIIDADGNVAIGAYDGTVQPAMRLNTKSHDNVAIGAGALTTHNLTDGSSGYNTAVGYSSGLLVSTGINNTLIGALAGDNVTSGSSNIIIGHGVDATSATASNQLNIGNMIIAKDNGKVISYGKGSNGFTYKEVMLSGSKSVAHNVWTNVAFIDHTHAAVVKLLLFSSNRGTLVGSMSTSYGSSQYTNHTISLNNLTSLQFRYSNSGYTLQVYQTNSSSAARDIYFSWTGMSTGTPALS